MLKNNVIGYRPTWAEVNLNNLGYNFHQIKKLLSPDVKVMVCVKADAYGHGIIAVSEKLVSCGVDFLGVASIDEGIRLRKEDIRVPILVLGALIKADTEPLFIYNLRPAIFTEDMAYHLDKMAKKMKEKLAVHIKVDTGMGRLGILYKDAFDFIKKANKLKFINTEGIFTHLACADTDRNFTLHQIDMFSQLKSRLKEESIHIPLFHSANSLGVIDYKESHFNMVRPGLAVYGVPPKENLKIKLKPVLTLKTKITYFKRVPKGYAISYGRTYITKKETTIVVLPIGYGDGYPRNLSNKAPVLIKDKRFKISGRICMDQIMVDVGDAKVKLGDEAVLIGSQGKNDISAEELAFLSATIPYEILCGLGSRIPRLNTGYL